MQQWHIDASLCNMQQPFSSTRKHKWSWLLEKKACTTWCDDQADEFITNATSGGKQELNARMYQV